MTTAASPRERGRRGGGAIRQHGGGWEASVSTTDDTGVRRRYARTLSTYREARKALAEMQRRVETGRTARDAAVTFTTWSDRWLAEVLPASNRRGSTQQLYAQHVRTHLLPVLGGVRLDRLRPSHVDAVVSALRARGSAPATQRSVVNVLAAVLDAAVREGLLADNPVRRAERPKIPRTEAVHLTTEQLAALLAAVKGTRLHPVVVMLAGTGLRRGELLAARWEDVDTDRAVLHVRGTLSRVGGSLVRTAPKSSAGLRTVHLGPAVLAALRAHRAAQAAERLAAGTAWSDEGWLFPTEIGTAWEPRNVLRLYAAAAAKVGAPSNLHALRHTAATAALAGGTDLRTLAALLGHADATTTLRVYGHTDDARQQAAAVAIGAALGL